MFFDTHAHYDDEAFDEDREQIINFARCSGVSLFVNASSDYKSSMASLSLAERYPYFYAAVGWHPHEAKYFDGSSPDLIRQWCAKSKTVAIGEIGLDYYYDLSERDVQRRVFEKQLKLAEELDIPVVIHDRDAHGDCLEIIERHPQARGVFHCFSGSPEMAEILLRKGWYLGFGGSATFKNNKKAPEVLAICPRDRFLLETDCPYLSPVPHRGERNDSSLLPFIAEKVGQYMGITAEEAASLGMENGKRLFGIK